MFQVYIALFLGLVTFVDTEVQCYKQEGDLYETNKDSEETCTAAKYCMVYTRERRIFQECYDDPNEPEHGCILDNMDGVMCACSTDGCNTINSTFTPDAVHQTYVECVSYLFDTELNPCASPHCAYYYPNSRGITVQECTGPTYFSSFDVPPPEDSLNSNQYFFYGNACYNLTASINASFVYCRCNTPKCNSQQPFSLSIGNVDCGMTHIEDYNFSANESFVNGSCKGHYCYIRETITGFYLNPITYEKGCINAAEHGKNKIKLGTFHHVNSKWYICNSTNCNANIEAALAAIKKPTGPTGGLEGVPETTTKSSSVLSKWLIFIFTLIRMTQIDP